MSSPTTAGTAARVAVLIPCRDEAQTIGGVVRAFRDALPEAAVYVYDNGSTDSTGALAREAGATVRAEPRRGKGYVIRAMFRDVEADVYVLVDGDGTYPAERVRELIRPVLEGTADMVIGSRLHRDSRSQFHAVNRLGNRLFRGVINAIFRVQVTDLLSGYRAFHRRVVKGLPFLSHGFESETELTVKCLVRGYRIEEIPIDLLPRPAGSRSKIRVVQDGVLILNTIIALFRDYKPLTAFGLVGVSLIALGLVPGFMVIREFLETGLILRLPSALLAVGLVLCGLLVAFTGLVLHTITRRFQELDDQLQRLIESRGERRA
ncbi:MAG TPA: glycosyltransferase [bacterium]